MAKHIWINQERVQSAASKAVKVGGVKFYVSISPFDTPKEIVGEYDKTTGRFSILFKYDDDEPTVKAKDSDGVEFWEGRHSKKLIKIVVPVDERNLGMIAVKTKVLNALHERRNAFKGDKSFARDLNQSVAEDVLASDFNSFESELVAQ